MKKHAREKGDKIDPGKLITGIEASRDIVEFAKERVQVLVTAQDGGRSMHIFESQTEAHNFVTWIQNYNPDNLDIEVNYQKPKGLE